MAYYGRRKTSDTDAGATGGTSGSNQRGQIFSAMPEHGWAYAVGTLGGKGSGQPNVTWRGAIWDVSGSSLSSRDAYTNSVTVSNVMSYGGDGAIVEGNLTSPIQLWSGVKYGIGWSAINGIFYHGMSAAGNSPTGVDDYYFHYKNNASSTPTDPFSASSSSYEGAQDNYVAYDPNVAPTITLGTMVPSGFITTTSPTFNGDFDDANENRGDKLNQFQIQVYRVSDNVKMWDSTQSATSSEQTAKTFTAGYGGTALVAGVQYQWRYRVSDQFGVWSSYSGYTQFTVNAGGSISTAAGTPSGKQETQSPTPFTGVWSHASALSTNAIEVRIKQGSTVIRTSPTIAKTVANGATASITWAETTFAALNWGQSLTYEMRGRDTGSLWSAWSAGRAFTTNASPTTPAVTFPTNGQVLTARPFVTVTSTDSDDTTATGFAVSLRIKNSAGTLLFTRSMTRNATTGVWEYQTTSTDLASFAQYRLDAVATDGTITTPYSAEILFTYSSGPVITVTAPTANQTLTTNTPTISFSQDQTQASYRVAIYEWVNGAKGNLAYDSGTIALVAASGVTVNHQVPSGYLHNATDYRVEVTSTNNLAVSATHGGVTFTVSFPAPAAPTGFAVSPIRVGNDVTPSAVLLTWDEAPYSTTDFRSTVVTRRPSGSVITDATILARLTSTSQHNFTDYYPVSGVTYTYAIYFEVIQGTDETESTPAENDAQVELEHVVINSVIDGTVRAGLRYGNPFDLTYDDDEVEVQPWGQALPHVFVGNYDARQVKGTWQLVNDRFSSGRDDLAGLKALRALRNVVCWRDQYGDRLFGFLTLTERKGQRGSTAEVTTTVREADYDEGEDS